MGKNKRPASYYIQCAKRQKGAVLGPDMVGFMCTCNFNERDCVREAYNVLNEFADILHGKEFPDNEVSGSRSGNVEDACKSATDKDGKSLNKSENVESTSAVSSDDDDDEPLDIEAAIKADVSELKKNNQENKKRTRRFNQVQCGAKNCVFIQTTLEDPLPLSLAIMDEIISSQKQRTKKLLRMIPVQATCKAYAEDIKKTVEELASAYFKESSKTYCVVFKVRNNTSLKKENMVFDLAAILHNANSKNRPDLTFPEVVLNVNVIKNVCCLSLLPHYFTKYCKYNLVLLASKDKVLPSEDDAGKDDKKAILESTVKGEDVTLGNNVNKGESATVDSSVKGEKEIESSVKDEKEIDTSVNNVEKEIIDSSTNKCQKQIVDSSVDKGEKVSIDSNVNSGKNVTVESNIDEIGKVSVESKEDLEKV